MAAQEKKPKKPVPVKSVGGRGKRRGRRSCEDAVEQQAAVPVK